MHAQTLASATFAVPGERAVDAGINPGGRFLRYTAAVPWRCPACQTQIQHLPLQNLPLPGVRYRCAVCRLEVMFDPVVGRLQVAPVADDGADTRERPTS